ncbi:MAG: PTS sugar transporter subunit IIA [Endomicrobia bacterium]|nr:PTS sugar transporter subunit IIA [Endomicrobiia bacterium]MCX7716373.1 PTS sugar transporter subunit IIA [Endomicrobiia bacterium]
MRIGIVIITHGQMAEGLKQTLFSIIGEKENVVSIPVSTEFTLDTLCNKVIEIIDNLNVEYVVIFTDMFGGTPCNVSLMVCKKRKNIHIISGVNLYMLISAINLRQQYENCEKINIDEYINRIIDEGKKCIVYVSQVFKDKLNNI